MPNDAITSLDLNIQPMHRLAYDKLVELIGSGRITMGERLDERALAVAMGISRTPLREAIGKLAKEGVVEHRPYQGNFVRTFTVKQVQDLYEVRKALEALAVHVVVTALTDEQLTVLRGILDDVHEALARDDTAAYGEADGRFHDTIAHFSDNQTLIESLDRLKLHIQLIRTVANRDPGVVERTAAEREHILAALEARDGARAAELMEAHIDGVKNAVVTEFERLAQA